MRQPPSVVVPMSEEKIRICWDYEVTVKPRLDIKQYPLLKQEQLSHMLNRGKKFSKMDLSGQLEMDPESNILQLTFLKGFLSLLVYHAMFQRTMETALIVSRIEGVPVI